MADFLAHSDWIFEHSIAHDLHDAPPPPSSESEATAPSEGVTLSLLKALWHQGDLPNVGQPSGLATSQLALLHSSLQRSGGDPSPQAPTVTLASNAITVTEGGSVALPISVSPVAPGDPLLVTIQGLASYETVTDGLDHQVFSGDTVILTAAEVSSGLTLNSSYSGPGHPVNTLSVSATEVTDHHVLTSAPQTITVTDPPAASGSTGNPLTLVVSGDNMHGTDPQFQVLVDGHQVGGTYTVTADHAAGQTQTITIDGNFDPTTAHQVQVQFINDGWDGQLGDGHDINLYVESISLNGATMTGAQGTNGATNGVVQAANANEAAMDVNGTLSFNVPADPPATSASSGGGTSAGGGGGIVNAASTGAGAPPSGSGFFVSPDGNDSNPGTIDAPFATLARAQQAMENSSIKTTYVRAGTYHLGNTLNLTAADRGETWQYYAPDGVDTAVLDGGNSTGIGINVSGAPNVTINGLKLQNFTQASIQAYTSPGTVIENNDVGFMNVAPPVEDAAASIGISVGDHVSVLNNYVHDVASIGIATFAFNAGDSNDGTVISGNVVARASLQSSDDGAIYVNDHDSGDSGGHVTISNNIVRDTGGVGFSSLRDIYLDDNSSNVTVTGNVLGPLGAGVASNGGNFNAIFVHDGNNNTITNNIIDLGSSSFMNIVTYGYDGGSLAGMGNNVFSDNVVLSNFSGGNNVDSGYGNFAYLEAPFSSAPASWFTVSNNLYWNYASGGSVFDNGNLTSDTAPIIENPQISGPAYTIASGSPVFSAMNFHPIAGGWGPPGFIVGPDNVSSV